MVNEMDVDMDIDLGLTDDLAAQEIDIDLSSNHPEPKPILSTPNDTTEPNSQDLAPHKVHLRGLDSLTTDDIKAFAAEYYEPHKPVHIEWIDDTSANLVYDSSEIAAEALSSFASEELADVSQLAILQTVQAKAFPAHPEINLLVRLAVVGDRKQAGARERSRFYLFNPEYDLAERRKRAGPRGPRSYRDRDDGGYRSQRYDGHEQRKRERDADFDASLYDDDEVAIAKRAGRPRSYRESSSGTESRGRGPRGRRYNDPREKELFPERGGRDSGRLRDRSASPSRDSDGDQAMDEARDAETRRNNIAAAENRLKAQMIKAQLKERGAKELFPLKANSSHRRSGAFDAADETADLFANGMAIMDGSGETHPRNGGSLGSRVTRNLSESDPSGFSIRGTAKSSNMPSQNFNIKGAAGVRATELFPSSLGDNAGKELFSETLEGRGQRRQKAHDLFY